MKSTIRVDFQGIDAPESLGCQSTTAFEPVIRVNLCDSEDVRDGLLKSFFQALGGESNWLRVSFRSDIIDGINQPERIIISPVKREEIGDEASVMLQRGRETSHPPSSSDYFSSFRHDDEVDFTTPKAKKYAFEEAKKLKENKTKRDEEIEYIPEYFHGKISAVKFTKAKVYYDVLDDYSGKVFEDIPSDDVKRL